jgi:hypothetical protein
MCINTYFRIILLYFQPIFIRFYSSRYNMAIGMLSMVLSVTFLFLVIVQHQIQILFICTFFHARIYFRPKKTQTPSHTRSENYKPLLQFPPPIRSICHYRPRLHRGCILCSHVFSSCGVLMPDVCTAG